MASLEFVKKQKEILEEELTIGFTGCLDYGVVKYKLTPSVIENYKAIIKKAESDYSNAIYSKAGIKLGKDSDENQIVKKIAKLTTADMLSFNSAKAKIIQEQFTLSFDGAPTKEELQTFFEDTVGETWRELYDVFLENNFNEFKELYTKFITPSK